MNETSQKKRPSLRDRLFHVIFESDTPMARGFDIVLIVLILLSVTVVMLDSVAAWRARYGTLFHTLEWGFTLIFTLEYALRLYCLERPLRYARSPYGLIDLISILPSWLSLIIPGANSLLVVRVLRIMRLFRVLRLMEFVGEGHLLMEALRRSHAKILMFFLTVMALVIVFGAMIYLIEPIEAGFTSIPRSIYWAIVTMTTVGYGDIAPITPLGQFISAMMMILGYSILAVPTGVFSAEVMRSIRQNRYSEEACPGCGHEGHEKDAQYCRLCGTWLDEDSDDPNREALEREKEKLREEREAFKEETAKVERERSEAEERDNESGAEGDDADEDKPPEDNSDERR
ncbi:ion transporter [Kushneria aurantia]|uniref:Ion transporter n=1 Tax=Kushneria aurantia TaxID=504092 RepID=A0ABV6G360_9GAMM|nr:ion transporter [Kushneria aurantia]